MEKISIDISSKEALLKCCRNELVPENPTVDKNGVEGLLEYRKNYKMNKRHPDSALSNGRTSWISSELYGIVPDSQDTIFNCWSLIKIYDAVYRNSNKTRDSECVLSDIINGIEVIDSNHIDEFNLLADRHHCIANFMPAPKGFNGFTNKYGKHPGKGDYNKDNDFPDIYYKRAKVEFPDMYDWINEHMEDYSLELFAVEITPWENGRANFQRMLEKPTTEQLYEIAKKMNALLSDRAERLIERKHSIGQM